jgi:hypothetical protein
VLGDVVASLAKIEDEEYDFKILLSQIPQFQFSIVNAKFAILP